jgi:hypothetical protein
MPTAINDEFQKTLDINLLTQKYGKHLKTDKDTYKLSRFDLNKLMVDKRRNRPSFTPSQQNVVDELTPIESQSVRIWNDRSYSKNQNTFNENQMIGKCGNFAFDNNLQRNNEERSRSNIEKRRS